jgi:hypothetical protein
MLKNKTETGAPKIDGRGRHGNQKTAEHREQFVIEHIKQFKVIESHYVRKNAKHEYLPTELSVAEMYRMYNEWRVKKGYPMETYDFYFRVFKEKFNLKFQIPKKDKCDTCETFKNLDTSSLTDELKQEQQNHLKDRDLVRQLKEKLKGEAQGNQDIVTAAFDLQKVLLCPFGQTSSFYYSRRLTNYNFTITELDNMQTACYFWNEAECKKGSCEIATSLQSYLIKKSKEGVKKFNLFSDRCGGQNNNRMIFVMISYVINYFDIDSIQLIYLVSGHSQSENDNAHSVIEQMVKNKTIYTPAEWEALIQCSFKKNPCTLDVIDHTDIVDFKSGAAFPDYKAVFADKTEEIMTEKQKEEQKNLNESINLPNRKVDKLYWSEIVILKFTTQDPDKMFFKYKYDEDFRSAIFSSPKRHIRQKEMETRKASMRKYSKPFGIAPQKKEDLLKLCSKFLIPPRHHAYYNNLPTNKERKENLEK